MNPLSPAEKILNGFFYGAIAESGALLFFTWLASVLNSVDLLAMRPVQILASVLLCLFVLTARLLALKLNWHRTDLGFMLPDEIDAALLGRCLGILAGIASGIYLATTLDL
ncbi:hypothetical protein [Cupriavidus necator]